MLWIWFERPGLPAGMGTAGGRALHGSSPWPRPPAAPAEGGWRRPWGSALGDTLNPADAFRGDSAGGRRPRSPRQSCVCLGWSESLVRAEPWEALLAAFWRVMALPGPALAPKAQGAAWGDAGGRLEGRERSRARGRAGWHLPGGRAAPEGLPPATQGWPWGVGLSAAGASPPPSGLAAGSAAPAEAVVSRDPPFADLSPSLFFFFKFTITCLFKRSVRKKKKKPKPRIFNTKANHGTSCARLAGAFPGSLAEPSVRNPPAPPRGVVGSSPGTSLVPGLLATPRDFPPVPR